MIINVITFAGEMSSRNFRKAVGSSLPPPSEDSDGEYRPLYVHSAAESKYAGVSNTFCPVGFIDWSSRWANPHHKKIASSHLKENLVQVVNKLLMFCCAVSTWYWLKIDSSD